MGRTLTIENFIVPLDMNGLRGRMLHLPSAQSKSTEILFIYGQHSSLERWWGLIRYLSHFGAVTVPDLPGLGGMESFYKINQKPTLDNFADYLAAFMKMRYRHKKVVVIGLSFGFVIVTRMLQRYPELTKKIILLVSLVGFAHKDDFSFSRRRLIYYRGVTTILSYQLPAFIFRRLALNRAVLGTIYSIPKAVNIKDHEDYKLRKQVEVWLWQNNDLRTQAAATAEFLELDNCFKQIDLPLWHIMAEIDQYFDSHRTEQHMRIIFKNVNIAHSKRLKHAPSVVADEAEAMKLIPAELRRVMRQL